MKKETNMYAWMLKICKFWLLFASLIAHPSQKVSNHQRHIENGELFEDDIVMDERLRKAILNGTQKTLSRTTRTDSVKNENDLKNLKIENEDDNDVLWPNATIYYKIEKTFLPESLELLEEVMKEFEERTCVRFRRRSFEKNYVIFSSDDNICSSSIGRVGGSQKIHLGEGCISRGRFEHEIMHTLGFIHEHSRPDRDQYLHVNFHNIKERYLSDFEKYSLDEVDYLTEEFNFNSVMIYRNQAFSKNGEDTLTAIGEPTLKFGQRRQFSIGDVRGINKLYKCKEYLKHPNYEGLVEEYHGKKNKRKRSTLMEQKAAK